MQVMVALVVAVLVLAGVHASAAAQEPYRLGAIFSITGPGSSLGIPKPGRSCSATRLRRRACSASGSGSSRTRRSAAHFGASDSSCSSRPLR